MGWHPSNKSRVQGSTDTANGQITCRACLVSDGTENKILFHSDLLQSHSDLSVIPSGATSQGCGEDGSEQHVPGPLAHNNKGCHLHGTSHYQGPATKLSLLHSSFQFYNLIGWMLPRSLCPQPKLRAQGPAGKAVLEDLIVIQHRVLPRFETSL